MGTLWSLVNEFVGSLWSTDAFEFSLLHWDFFFSVSVLFIVILSLDPLSSEIEWLMSVNIGHLSSVGQI